MTQKSEAAMLQSAERERAEMLSEISRRVYDRQLRKMREAVDHMPDTFRSHTDVESQRAIKVHRLLKRAAFARTP